MSVILATAVYRYHAEADNAVGVQWTTPQQMTLVDGVARQLLQSQVKYRLAAVLYIRIAAAKHRCKELLDTAQTNPKPELLHEAYRLMEQAELMGAMLEALND